VATRGSVVRHHPPRRYSEIEQMVATGPLNVRSTWRRSSTRFRATGRGARRGQGDGTAQAPLLHLREDGGQGQGVRRDLRPGGRAHHGRLGQGLLGGAGCHPRGVGAVQAVSRTTSTPQVQPVPVAAHHGRRAAGQSHRSPDPYGRDAPPAERASPRTGGTRSGRPPRTWRGCSASWTGRRRAPIPPSSSRRSSSISTPTRCSCSPPRAT